jgi:hypothetical protein
MPPADDAELAVWKCFVSSTESNVWELVVRWLKRYGNPFAGDVVKDDWLDNVIYRLAITYTYKK